MSRLPLSVLLLALAVTVPAAPLRAQTGPCGLFEAIEPGDTLATISARCAVPLDLLRAANPGIADAPDPGGVVALVLPEGTAQVPSPGPRMLKAPPPPRRGAEAPSSPAPLPQPQPDPPSRLVLLPVPGGGGAPGADAAARQVYLDEMVGEWAPDPAACGADATWRMTPERVSLGPESCTIDRFAADGGVVALDVACARPDGGDRTGRLRLRLEGDRLELAGVGPMSRCPIP